MLLCSIFFLLTSRAFAMGEPLPIDKAFHLSASLHEDHVVILRFDIAPHHYLYQTKLKFEIQQPKEASLGSPLMPKAEMKADPFFGKQAVYEGKVNISLPILNWEEGILTLVVNYQGCSSQGYCYPPTQRVIQVSLDGSVGEALMPSEELSNPAMAWLARQPIWLIPFGFIGFGLLLSLTPCTFPMIPILSSIILGYRNQLTTQKAFLLSLTYVLSMASVYAVIGVLAGFAGSNLQMAFQATWVIVLFSALFILLALCSFAGIYWLKLPAFVEKHLLKLSHRQKAGTYIGVAIMGALSTLIVSPCVTAPLIGVISYISQTGHAELGGMALFFMGLGMGGPLLIIGTLEGRWMPKSGYWTRTVEIMLGILLLGIAIELLDKILPGQFVLSLWGGLLLVAALYLGAFFSKQKMRAKTLRRGLGLVMMIYGVSLMIGGFMGSDDLFAPLKHIAGKVNHKSSEHVGGEFKVIRSLADLKAALAEAQKHKQRTLVDVYATWCAYCKVMDKTLFQDPEILSKLSDFQRLKVDVTPVDAESRALLQYLNVIAPPAILFFGENGLELPRCRLVGEVKREALLKVLDFRVCHP